MVWPICRGLVNPTGPSPGRLALLLEEAATEARGLYQKCLHLSNLTKDYFIKILSLLALTPSLPSVSSHSWSSKGTLQQTQPGGPSRLSPRVYLRAAPPNVCLVCYEMQGHAQSTVCNAMCVYFANSEPYAAAEGTKEIQSWKLQPNKSGLERSQDRFSPDGYCGAPTERAC